MSAGAPTKSSPLAAIAWLLKLGALTVGGVVTLLALSTLVGLVIETLWLQLLIAAIAAIGVPLLLADRLLPSDGSSRPGLLTDVTAMLWMATATVAFMLATTVLRAPIDRQAARWDDEGFHQTAWAMRWIGGLQTPLPVPPAAVAAPVVAQAEAPKPNAVAVAGAEYTPAPSGEAKREPIAPVEMFKRWAPSVVTIKTTQDYRSGMGTGFVIDMHGTIATNQHVVDGATKLAVKLFDGTEVDKVELLESNAQDDLALIRIKTDQPLVPVVLGVSDAVAVGEAVILIGNPIGLEHTLTDGLVSARRIHDGKKYLQISAPASPGSSGGPVFNSYGDVVGVTVAGLGGENLNAAVPIDLLKPMIKSEYPGAKSLGASRW